MTTKMETSIKTSIKTLLLGGIIVDRYFEVDHYPQPGQDTLIHNAFDRVGGCALNVAVTLNNLGTVPYIVSKLGDDPLGITIEQYVKSLGMPTPCISIASGKQTGYCLTILDQTGERTFFTYKGIEVEYSPTMIPPDLRGDMAFAYITGYYLLNRQTTAAVLELVEQLRQTKCQILFDPGPLVGNMDPSQLRKLLTVSDWVVPNSYELAMIQDKLGIDGEPVKWLLDQGCQNVVVKKGSQGVDVHTTETSFSLKGYAVKPVDTSGAGDSFVGGLIHGLANAYPLIEAVKLANACGAYTTTIEGPHGIFSSGDIHKMVPRQ